MAIGRRQFLIQAGAGLWASRTLQAEHHLISANPLITSVELGAATGRYVSLDDFYVRDHYSIPAIHSNSLRIEGAVEHPQEVSEEQFKKLKIVEMGAILECAGSLVGTNCQACNGLWRGWWLRDVLALAKPAPASKFVHLYGRDGFTRSVPIAHALQDGLLATHLNNVPLRPNHGAGLRAVFPGWYGMNSVKWLERIAVADKARTEQDPNLYMQAQTNSDGTLDLQSLPRIQVKSVMLAPSAKAVLRRGTLEVKGLAWSGAARVVKVDVSADGGNTWKPAQLTPRPAFEWMPWRCLLKLARPGPTVFACRATDESNAFQPATRDPKRADPYANNWYHRVDCLVI